jgi:hypothetical protein
MSNKKGLIGSIIGVFSSPRSTFESIDEKDLRKSISVILLIALVSAAASSTYMSKINIPLPNTGTLPAMGNLRSVISVISGLVGFLGVIISWILITALVYAVAKMFGGQGMLKGFYAQTGFAYSPFLIQHLLRLIDALTFNSSLGIPTIGNRLISAFLGTFNVFGIINIILLIIAVSVNQKIGVKKAAIITLLTTTILLLPSLILFQ